MRFEVIPVVQLVITDAATGVWVQLEGESPSQWPALE